MFISQIGFPAVRYVDRDGIITTVAGRPQSLFDAGETGDGGQAVNAELVPYGMGFHPNGELYIVSSKRYVRKISRSFANLSQD